MAFLKRPPALVAETWLLRNKSAKSALSLLSSGTSEKSAFLLGYIVLKHLSLVRKCYKFRRNERQLLYHAQELLYSFLLAAKETSVTKKGTTYAKGH